VFYLFVFPSVLVLPVAGKTKTSSRKKSYAQKRPCSRPDQNETKTSTDNPTAKDTKIGRLNSLALKTSGTHPRVFSLETVKKEGQEIFFIRRGTKALKQNRFWY
jgi:hypothetical protein